MEWGSEGIVDVYESNLEEEFAVIMELVQKYPYIAMDTEFPGVVYRHESNFTSVEILQTLCANVNTLKMIQLGIALYGSDGKPAEPNCCWQFNFRFSIDSDPYDVSSINLLKEAGIDFERLSRDGIDILRFSYMLMGSGLVCNPKVHWVAFHSSYDFLYTIKAIVNRDLPTDTETLFCQLGDYFPSFFDIKHIMQASKGWTGGLDKLATDMDIIRVGPTHQAGSDSLLTGKVFFKMIYDPLYLNFKGDIDTQLSTYRGHSFGLHSLGADGGYGAFYPPTSGHNTPARR